VRAWTTTARASAHPTDENMHKRKLARQVSLTGQSMLTNVR
jgi:hypothetical protein